MPVDRDQWKKQIGHLPSWPCPTCGKGTFGLMPNMPILEETGPSKTAHDHPAWDPDWIENRFIALMKCSLSTCGEVAAVSGTSPSDFYDDYEAGEQTLINLYEPRSIDPCPVPILIPANTPESVREAIVSAAMLTWQSDEAGANKIRSAVEHMLDAKKVKKQVTKNGKKTRLNLHDRIVQFQKKDQENGDILLAIKWLGNSGSHTSKLTRDDVLDAFDMLELVLENLYGKTKQMIMKKVAAVNKKKGPVKASASF